MKQKTWFLAMLGGTVLLTLLSLTCDKSADYLKMDREEILKAPIDELATLPFEDLMKISDRFSYKE